MPRTCKVTEPCYAFNYGPFAFILSEHSTSGVQASRQVSMSQRGDVGEWVGRYVGRCEGVGGMWGGGGGGGGGVHT